MTTAGDFRTTAARVACDVNIAGVPWPAYKVIALVVGVLVAAVIGVATTTAAAAVLGGAAVGTLAWVALGAYCASCR